MPGQARLRAALYVRVSTRDGRQHVENQNRELERYAKQRRLEIVRRYIDKSTGSRGTESRRMLALLIAEAHQGRFDIVLVFALDRFTREGVFKTFQYIERLKNAGVEFRSITEEHINTAGATGEMFLSIAASMARLEREQIRTRIKAGLDRAKAHGKKLGRPAAAVDVQQLRRLIKHGNTIDQVKQITGHSRATIYRRIAEADAKLDELAKKVQRGYSKR